MRAARRGLSAGLDTGKKPSSTSPSASARVSSVDSAPPRSRLPSATSEIAVALRRVGAEQRLLRGASGLDGLGPLGGGQAPAIGEELLLHTAGEGGVHVVAAEHQVLAHGEPPQHGAFRRDARVHEGEVRGAAAHVHHEHQAHVGQHLRQIRAVASGVVVEGRLRLLDEGELLQARLARRAHGEGARRLVEGGGDGDDDLLLSQRRLRVSEVPRPSHVRQQQGAGLHRRELGHIRGSTPRKDGSGAIHAWVAQPALRGGDEPAGHSGPLPASELAHHVGAGIAPRELQRLPGQLMARGDVDAGGQQRARSHLALPDELGNGKILDGGSRPACGVHGRDRAVGGAQIDTDDAHKPPVPLLTVMRWR